MRSHIILSCLALSVSSICLADPTSTLGILANPPMTGGYYACTDNSNQEIRVTVDFKMNRIRYVLPPEHPDGRHTSYEFKTQTVDAFPGAKDKTYIVNVVGTLDRINFDNVNAKPEEKTQFMSGKARHPSDERGTIITLPWHQWHAHYSFIVNNQVKSGNLTCHSAQDK